MQTLEECLLMYRRTLRQLLYSHGVLSNPGVTDDWILDQISRLVGPKKSLPSYEDLVSKLCRLEMRENFMQFVNTGECINEHYLTHLDSCPKCQEAVKEAMNRQAKAFENLARYLRKKSDKK